MTIPTLALRKTLVRPLGGHHCIENGLTIRGETLDEVANKLRDYRLNNMIPAGDPVQEILNYYRIHWPYMVDVVEDPPAPTEPDKVMAQWMAWVRRQWVRPAAKAASVKEAETRWKVCVNCPYNVPLEPMTMEENDILRKAFMLRRGQSVPKKLGFCSRHLWDNSTSVFIEAPRGVSGIAKDAAPYPTCWVA